MKNVTLKDVAKAAGVSYATVSQALSGITQTAEPPRERALRLRVERRGTQGTRPAPFDDKKSRLPGGGGRPLKGSSPCSRFIGEMSARARGYNIRLCNWSRI